MRTENNPKLRSKRLHCSRFMIEELKTEGIGKVNESSAMTSNIWGRGVEGRAVCGEYEECLPTENWQQREKRTKCLRHATCGRNGHETNLREGGLILAYVGSSWLPLQHKCEVIKFIAVIDCEWVNVLSFNKLRADDSPKFYCKRLTELHEFSH